MNPRRSATVAAAFYPAVVIAGWAVVSLAGIGSPRIETSGAAQVVDRLAPSLTANFELAAAIIFRDRNEVIGKSWHSRPRGYHSCA